MEEDKSRFRVGQSTKGDISDITRDFEGWVRQGNMSVARYKAITQGLMNSSSNLITAEAALSWVDRDDAAACAVLPLMAFEIFNASGESYYLDLTQELIIQYPAKAVELIERMCASERAKMDSFAQTIVGIPKMLWKHNHRIWRPFIPACRKFRDRFRLLEDTATAVDAIKDGSDRMAGFTEFFAIWGGRDYLKKVLDRIKKLDASTHEDAEARARHMRWDLAMAYAWRGSVAEARALIDAMDTCCSRKRALFDLSAVSGSIDTWRSAHTLCDDNPHKWNWREIAGRALNSILAQAIDSLKDPEAIATLLSLFTDPTEHVIALGALSLVEKDPAIRESYLQAMFEALPVNWKGIFSSQDRYEEACYHFINASVQFPLPKRPNNYCRFCGDGESMATRIENDYWRCLAYCAIVTHARVHEHCGD